MRSFLVLASVVLLALVVWMLVTSLVRDAAAAAAVGAEEAAPAEKTPPAEPPAPEKQPELKLDKIKIDVKAKRIEVLGRFCLQEGILDYFAVISGGQEYESVVALDCKGSLLHLKLLELGAVPGPTQEVLDQLRKNPPKDRKLPERTGTPFRITLEWEKDGKVFSAPAEQMLFNRATKKPAEPGDWVFTGSFFAKDPDDDKEYYMADVDQSLIGVLYTPSAVINFSRDAGNPYAADDSGYAVNKDVVPPRGTPVKLVIELTK